MSWSCSLTHDGWKGRTNEGNFDMTVWTQGITSLPHQGLLFMRTKCRRQTWHWLMTWESISSTTSVFVPFGYRRSDVRSNFEAPQKSSWNHWGHVKTRLTSLLVIRAAASAAVMLDLATVSSLLMDLAPWVCRQQMANSSQIVSVQGKHRCARRRIRSKRPSWLLRGIPNVMSRLIPSGKHS